MWKPGQLVTVKEADILICRVTKDTSYFGRRYSSFQRNYRNLTKLPEDCHLRVVRIIKCPARG